MSALRTVLGPEMSTKLIAVHSGRHFSGFFPRLYTARAAISFSSPSASVENLVEFAQTPRVCPGPLPASCPETASPSLPLTHNIHTEDIAQTNVGSVTATLVFVSLYESCLVDSVDHVFLVSLIHQAPIVLPLLLLLDFPRST